MLLAIDDATSRLGQAREKAIDTVAALCLARHAIELNVQANLLAQVQRQNVRIREIESIYEKKTGQQAPKTAFPDDIVEVWLNTMREQGYLSA